MLEKCSVGRERQNGHICPVLHSTEEGFPSPHNPQQSPSFITRSGNHRLGLQMAGTARVTGKGWQPVASRQGVC